MHRADETDVQPMVHRHPAVVVQMAQIEFIDLSLIDVELMVVLVKRHLNTIKIDRSIRPSGVE